MNKRLKSISRWVGVAVISVAAVLLGASILVSQGHPDTESAASDLGHRVDRRMALLDRFIDEAAALDPDLWMDLENLPADMVVYRYVQDTLQSWAHQFPVRSDDIRPRALVQRLGDTRSTLVSPLAQVTGAVSYENYGPKWYLMKAVDAPRCRIVAGLEIVNELKAGSLNGVNPRLKIGDRYSILPITGSIGVPVEVGGVPLFKLTSEQVSEPTRHNSVLFWLGVILLLAGSLILLRERPTWSRFGVTLAAQTGFLTWIYFYGRQLGRASQLFSPLLYAGSPTLYSLGAVVVINLLVTTAVIDMYEMRWTFLKTLRKRNRKWFQALLAGFNVLLICAITAYIHLTFKSILINSNICLELFKVGLLNLYTAIVYVSFLLLSLTLPLLAQLLSPLLRSLLGIRYDVFSTGGRILFAVITGAYFVTVSSTLGFRKEQSRVDVWANRLAMDRDIALEIQLRGVEGQIADDQVIGALAALENSHDLIRGRLVDTYMGRIAQDYDVSVLIPDGSAGQESLFSERIRSGVRLADNSHFFYSSSSGRARYTGLYTYYMSGFGAQSLLILVESKHNREDRGYLSLLGISEPGRISIPPVYSYAKYADDRLVSYKGSYAYPTVISGRFAHLSEGRPDGHVDADGFCHFFHSVSEEETVVISRPRTEILSYIVVGFLFSIIAFLLITMLTWSSRRRSGYRRYYQTRISGVIYVSLTLTLVAMAIFSVWFVYKRNNADMQSIMTSRINTIQTMLQDRLRGIDEPEKLYTQAVRGDVESIGNNLKSDISLFNPSGLLVMSTTPEVYERMILGLRLDENAYDNIVNIHKRFFIQREKIGARRFYTLYAPIFNADSRMVAIASSPFTDLTYDLESEAVTHIATIITVFLLLLLISRVVTREVVGRLFRPVSEMSRKMSVTDVEDLQPIEYNQDDELTGLVQTYNRMVHDLGESSRRLAQVERDKAWTDMARRVAHDLKNPLTPIKLQLQMLIRMKNSGNEAWKDRFDDVASTVLYHVDLLADSAVQFSDLAKLYDQPMERIDLNDLLRREVTLYDSRQDVDIEYFGLEGAVVMGQRPQLTRVVVNLLTNAIQAIEEKEGEKRVLIAVRNADRDGYYDIVVEDNGPGVDEADQERIFTPDFTTKTSGSGLGLAICKRFVEHAGGTISYSRSFSLGGACFTVRYPKA